MKKKSLNDDIFDAVLSQAFTEVVAEEFADVPKPEPIPSDSVPVHSRRSGRKRRIRLLAGLLIAAAVGLAVWLVWMWLSPDGYSMETPEYVYGYIPEDYVVTDYWDKGAIMYTFENPIDNTYFKLNYYRGVDTTIQVDSENSIITELCVNGYNVQYIQYTISECDDYIWSDGTNIFNLTGTAPQKVMLKIAEHITRKPQ